MMRLVNKYNKELELDSKDSFKKNVMKKLNLNQTN